MTVPMLAISSSHGICFNWDKLWAGTTADFGVIQNMLPIAWKDNDNGCFYMHSQTWAKDWWSFKIDSFRLGWAKT